MEDTQKVVEISSQLSQKQIVEAATNEPSLSDVEVTFNSGKTFKIVYLGYDDHLEFLTKLTPLLSAFLEGSTGITPTGIIQFCAKDLLELGHIVLRQTDPSLKLEDVKQVVGSPLKLASAVFSQIEKNNLIYEISAFFAQIAPILKAMNRK